MSSAVNILNVQKAPVQTQSKSAKQTGDSILSFLNLLQNTASSGRIENIDKLNRFQNNNANKSTNIENTGKNIVVNSGAKINDINNAKISLEDSKDINDKSGGLAAVLVKVLNGESAELPEFDEASLAEAVKEIMAGIIIKDEDSEKIDIGKILEMLGVPAEIVPEMIAAVIEPKMIVERVEKAETAENTESRQIREVSGITAVKGSPEITAETESPPVLISVSEAEDFIAEIAEYIYSERTAEMVDSAEAMPEQVQENIADFADIVEENRDFTGAIADYVAEKIENAVNAVSIEVNNPAATVKMNAENIKEVIRKVLNEEQPEIEVLSAVKTSEAVSEKSAPAAPTMLDILNSMKKAVNITQVQSAAAENNNPEMLETVEMVQEIANPLETASNVSVPEILTDKSLPATETTANVNDTNDAETVQQTAEVNHLAGIVNAGLNAQSLESEVNIERFSTDISRVITEKMQSIFNRKGQGADETFELRLRLKPAELGEVFMKISYKNGNVGLNIVAANAVAERAILSQMGDLRASLNAQEVNLAEFDVNHFNNYNQNAQNQNSSQNNDSKNNRGGNERTGLNSINEVQNQQEAERREAVANYIKSRRIFYKTI